DVVAGMMFGATLAYNNIAGHYALTAKNLDAKPFTLRFASVLYFTFAFLMCHDDQYSVFSIQYYPMPSICILVNCWRWPFFTAYPFRRFFLNTVTLSPFT